MTTGFFTDSYFHIGNAHLGSGKPCQDYAISGTYNDSAFAIVADGCSSGRHTDVGSRLVSLATASAIRDYSLVRGAIDCAETPSEILLRQSIVLAGMQDTLGLISDDMLATCVWAYLSPTGGIVHISGDGVVAIKYGDGRIVMHNFEWQNNMPYYPAYKNGRLEDFIKAQGGQLDKECLVQDVCVYGNDGKYEVQTQKKHTLSTGISGVTIVVEQDDIANDVEFVAVFSDGVTQIDGVDWKEAVVQFLAFKNTAGEFAKRRMIRGIKDVNKKGKGPFDDISYAVIGVSQIE